MRNAPLWCSLVLTFSAATCSAPAAHAPLGEVWVRQDSIPAPNADPDAAPNPVAREHPTGPALSGLWIRGASGDAAVQIRAIPRATGPDGGAGEKWMRTYVVTSDTKFVDGATWVRFIAAQ